VNTPTKILLAMLTVAVLAGLAALWLISYPWRLAARVCGVSVPRGNRHSTLILEGVSAGILGFLGLRQVGRSLRPAWHPCENCGAPIDHPSRVSYCSQACRRDANIRHRAALEGVASYE
jgi:hypothetical protein